MADVPVLSFLPGLESVPGDYYILLLTPQGAGRLVRKDVFQALLERAVSALSLVSPDGLLSVSASDIVTHLNTGHVTTAQYEALLSAMTTHASLSGNGGHVPALGLSHTSLADIGVTTHAVIDTTLSYLSTHASNAAIHFQIGSIDHQNIMNHGTNSHSAIDTHIANTALHGGKTSVNLTLSGSWTNYNSSVYGVAVAEKCGQVVSLRGLVAGGSGVITTLPLGYRPPVTLIRSTDCGSGHSRLDIAPDGTITFISGASSYVSLSFAFMV